MKTCGDCKHWVRREKYTWGECNATLPVWAKIGSPLVDSTSYWADRCKLFTKRTRKAKR